MKEILTIPSDLLEEYIIISSVNNKSYFLKIYKYLRTFSFKKSYFNDEKNQMIFNIIASWFDKYNSFPSLKDIQLLVEKIPSIDNEIKVLLKGMITKYYNEDYTQINQDMLLEETQKFIQEARVYEAMLLAQKDIQEENYGAIVDKMKEAVNVNFDKDLGLSIKNIDGVFDAVDKITCDDSSIDTGIPTLNNLLSGGWKKSEIYILAATPGLGKTLFLGCFALNAFLAGKKVLVLTMETSVEALYVRYLENLVGKKKTEITSNTENAKKILSTKLDMLDTDGDLIVKEYPANQPSSNDFISLITELEMYKNWKPDLLVVDYILITAANDKRLDPGDSYKYYKRVTEDLRNIAKEYKIPILSACQINREGQSENGGTKAITTSKSVSESRGILDTADVFMTLNQTAIQKNKNEIMIYIEKNRNGKAAEKIVCDIDYDLMMIRQKDLSRASSKLA